MNNRSKKISLEKLLILKNSSLRNALLKLENNGKGILFVVGDDKKIVNVITDGDIRRSFLNNFDIRKNLNDVLFEIKEHGSRINFTVANTNTSINDLIELCKDGVKIIPLVNDKNIVVDYFEYNASFSASIASPVLDGNELNYLADCIKDQWVSSNGKYNNRFEKSFKSYIGSKYALTVSSGTAALHLALLSLGIKEGDEVIVPDLTFAATINSVLYCNATPVIVDIEHDTWCINPDLIEKNITKNTKAIIVVHLLGNPAKIEKINEIAKNNNIFLIEDCAESLGAVYNDKMLGSFGDIGCFSFFGNKIITTGEGGMCTTNNDQIANKIMLFRDHGMSQSKKYWHDEVGYNYRLTNIQSAVGLAQFEKIEHILSKRQKIMNYYDENLFKPKKEFFKKSKIIDGQVIWLVSIILKNNVNRQNLIESLSKNNIDIRYFFYPLSDMKIYKSFCRNFTSVAHELGSTGIHLPTSLKYSESDLDKIINEFNDYFKNSV